MKKKGARREMNSRMRIIILQLSVKKGDLAIDNQMIEYGNTILVLAVVVGHDDASRVVVAGGGLLHAHGGVWRLGFSSENGHLSSVVAVEDVVVLVRMEFRQQLAVDFNAGEPLVINHFDVVNDQFVAVAAAFGVFVGGEAGQNVGRGA